MTRPPDTLRFILGVAAAAVLHARLARLRRRSALLAGVAAAVLLAGGAGIVWLTGKMRKQKKRDSVPPY